MHEKNNISISHPSDGHASHVERVILSLQRLLYQQIEQAVGKCLNWIKFLPDAVSIINNSKTYKRDRTRISTPVCKRCYWD